MQYKSNTRRTLWNLDAVLDGSPELRSSPQRPIIGLRAPAKRRSDLNEKRPTRHLRLLAVLALGLLAATLRGGPPEQSPIDFRTKDVVRVRPDGLPRLEFDYRARTDLQVENTGSPDEFASVRANVPAGAGRLEVDGVTYELKQFHFHTPSEHRIDGEAFPMEMHLVHQAAKGALLVVAVLIEEGHRHGELEKVFDHLPEEGASVPVAGFKLSRLLPGDRRSLRYRGSLTTPPFTEGVKWVVLVRALELPEDQIEAFRALFPDGNSRETQALNGRTVTTDAKWKMEKAAALRAEPAARGTR